jgi:hypothetical protein
MRMGRIGGSNIRAAHVKWIQKTVILLNECTHAAYGSISSNDPAVDFEPSATESLASARLVDGKRDEVLGVMRIDDQVIHNHPGSRTG